MCRGRLGFYIGGALLGGVRVLYSVGKAKGGTAALALGAVPQSTIYPVHFLYYFMLFTCASTTGGYA